MTAEDALGAVTICKRGRTGLYADDLGLSVRGSKSAGARFAWADIDYFDDGGRKSDGDDLWVLVIVLRTGQRVPVDCTAGSEEAVLKTLAAIRQVARHYEIPADLTGVPMTDNGRPVRSGLYEDPGGQPGLRYWDGTQWSPLLRVDSRKAGWLWGRPVRKSAGFWSDFPVADGRWNYAAGRARRATVGLACLATVTAALLTVGLVIWLWWDHGSSHRHINAAGWFWSAGYAAVFAMAPWQSRRFYRKLDKASRASLDRSLLPSSSLTGSARPPLR
jgi:hypothetical protein